VAAQHAAARVQLRVTHTHSFVSLQRRCQLA
jgi:hypothetical protein